MLLRIPEIEPVEIVEKDVVITYYKDSGPGGQHKNKTMSSVRLQYQSHTITCSQERDQRRNKQIAFKELEKIIREENERKAKVDFNNSVSEQYENQGNRGSCDRNYDFKKKVVYQDGEKYTLKKIMKGDFSEIYGE